MTTPGPDHVVGSIIARVGLDTTGLKRGEADGTAALKRTTAEMNKTVQAADKTQRSVDRVTTSVKRNADVHVESVRRTSAANRQAQRDMGRTTGGRAGGGSGGWGGGGSQGGWGGGPGGGAAGGAVAGAIIGSLLAEGLQAVGDGKGGRRDAYVGLGASILAGGGLGAAVGGPAGAVIGTAAGGLYGLMKNEEKLFAANAATLRREQETTAREQRMRWQSDVARMRKVRHNLLGGDPLGRAMINNADARRGYREARADRFDTSKWAAQAQTLAPVMGGMFDEPDKKTRGDVGKAADKAEAALRRVANAEDRLAKLRAAEKPNLTSIRIAERALAEARDKAATAAAGAAKAQLPSGLGSKELLDRMRIKTADVQQLDRDTRTLVRKGLAAPILNEMLQLEKTAPGTVHRVATGISRAQVIAMNAQQVQMQKAADDLIKAPLDRAMADAQRNAEAKAGQLAKAVRAAFVKAFSTDGVNPNMDPVVMLPGVAGGKPQIKNDPLGSLFPSMGAQPRDAKPVPTTSILITGDLVVQGAQNPQQLAEEAAKEARTQALGGHHVLP